LILTHIKYGVTQYLRDFNQRTKTTSWTHELEEAKMFEDMGDAVMAKLTIMKYCALK